MPDLVSGLAALLMVIPVLRGDFLYSHRLDFLSLANVVLIFYLTAVFWAIGLGKGSVFMYQLTVVISAVVIALANYSPSRFGGLAVIALAAVSASNIYSASGAMGFFGFLLILTATAGVLLAVDMRKVFRNLKGKSGRLDQ